MKEEIKILFCCHGNICRSPMAEFILKDLVKKQGLEGYIIDSAATSNEETGNGIYPPAQRCLREHGISDAVHSARRIKESDYGFYDRIIGMDYMNIRNLKRFFDGDPAGKISMLNETEIADPWYSGDFETAYQQILQGCKRLIGVRW